jgi:uncharacterized protein (DUF927 family)
MYDYKTNVINTFKNFLQKQERFIMISLTYNKYDVDKVLDSITNIYSLKYDNQYMLKPYVFIPPDLPEDYAITLSNIKAFYNNQDDIPIIQKYLVELDKMSNEWESLRYLLALSKYTVEDS